MQKPKSKPPPEQTPFQRFANLAKRIVDVPKSELRRREQNARKVKKGRPAA
jgi:hypothetical protein